MLYFCKDDEMALVELDKESTLFKAEWQVVLLIKKNKKTNNDDDKRKENVADESEKVVLFIDLSFLVIVLKKEDQ